MADRFAHTHSQRYGYDNDVTVVGAEKTYPSALPGSAGGMGLGSPARSDLAFPKSTWKYDAEVLQTSQKQMTGGDRRW